MKKLVFVVVGALVLAAGAQAKGPTQASVKGPGLSTPIEFQSMGDPSANTPFGNLVMLGGFFSAVYGQSPDPMLSKRPNAKLGPKYTVTYVLPVPNGTASRIVQDVYPYATPQPVTYMRPGQNVFGGQKTEGGWYLAAPDVKTALVRAGLPRKAVLDSSHGSSLALFLGIGAGLLATGGAGAAYIRRRKH